MSECLLCPRRCGVDREVTSGACKSGTIVRLARAAPHLWEEPCISGTKGSGAVFFSGCSLGCCFCQNHTISAEGFGKDCSVQQLAEIFSSLEAQEVHNLNLVNPTHWQPWITEALSIAKLKIPVVWNSSGFELAETLKAMAGVVKIYLPDLKFFSRERAARYAAAPEYFRYASRAIEEMVSQTGPCVENEDGILLRGTIVRHLVLPKGRQDSKQLLRWLATTFPNGEIRLSLMSQYTPFYQASRFPELCRRVSTFEYQDVLEYAISLGLTGYMQERNSAQKEYTPPFDLTGINVPQMPPLKQFDK